MKYFSLFAGIGGFEYGIEKAYKDIKETSQERNKKSWGNLSNIDREPSTLWRGESSTCIGYSEIDKYAKAIYRYHYPEHKNYGDATKIVSGELPDFDLLVGGFPCQSFSIAGKRKGMSGEDIRGTLFFEIWRIARDKRPRTLLLENVLGLLSSQGGKDFQTILQSLDEIGYDVEWDCLNSKNFGVPQNRQRVFIVGHIRGQSFKKVFPVKRFNTEIAGMEQGKEIMYYQKADREIARIYGIDGLAPALHLKTGGWQEPKIIMRNGRDNRNCLRSGRTSELGIKGHSIRRLTPTECERLQAFPDGWTEWGIIDNKKVKISDTQRYKCLGNAVTTSVIKEIIKKMFI